MQRKMTIFALLPFVVISCSGEHDRRPRETINVAMFCTDGNKNFILIDKSNGDYFQTGTRFPIKKCSSENLCLSEPFGFYDVRNINVGDSKTVSGNQFKVLSNAQGILRYNYRKHNESTFSWMIKYDSSAGVTAVEDLINREIYSLCAGELTFDDMSRINNGNFGPFLSEK